jgi:hypothetical protein
MKKIGYLLVGMGLLTLGWGAAAQSDLDVFPEGTTTMIYSILAEDMTEAQSLELSVTVHGDGRYTVRMVTEQTGAEDELATGFGFLFGATQVAAGSGHDVSYNSLEALMDQRSRLQEGQDYLLPGGGVFTDIVGTTIGGVWCLEGSLVDEEDPNERVTIAFALTHPVYISPRIRAEELRDGEWVEVFVLELVEYIAPEGV